MMPWVRAGRRWLAAVVLTLLSSAGAWSLVDHATPGHDDGHRAVVVHDASAHVYRSAVPAADEHPLHCVLCHVVRSLRPLPETSHAFVPVATIRLPINASGVVVAQVFPAAQPPLRSPPHSTSPVVLA